MPKGRGSARLRSKPKVEFIHENARGDYSLTTDGRNLLDAYERGADLSLSEKEVIVLRAIATEEAEKAADLLALRDG